ncbi:MAG: lysine 5,6-aminomutase subunit alpha [Bradymonadaceae bacterium]
MTTSKLGIDPADVERARAAASDVADRMDAFIRDRSTDSVERTVVRLFGVDGVDDEGVPLPNVLVDAADRAGQLSSGIARTVARAVAETGRDPKTVAEGVASGALDLYQLPRLPPNRVREIGGRLAERALDRIDRRVERRDELLRRAEEQPEPLKYVIVATGDIHEDAVQAKSAARQGADIVAVIRSTGQSLLDYVPVGATTDGSGGTFATRENFRIMREALDEVGEELGRYIRLCNYCSGLCMPEIAALGALERLDVMLNDALYGILFRDINPQRTFVDQYFSRMINAYAGVVINTGEDNYLTTADPVEAADTVVASQLINEQLGRRCGLGTEQLGIGHAMEMDPELENGFLLELAQAQLTRELFPGAPIKFMPPTKHMTGNIFRGHVQDALFNLAGAMTNQGIQLLGMMTEAMHTPHMSDRYLALENAQLVMNNARSLADEIEFREGGIVRSRAHQVLADATELLEDVRQRGMFEALADGLFADVERPPDGGKGADGAFDRAPDYYNPVEEELRERLGLD